jgi:arylformamidase
LRARVRTGGADWEIELDRPASLAIVTPFAAEPFAAEPFATEPFATEGVRAFGAPHASSHPLHSSGFSGSVASGASCNCRTITLTPHCNATHTECAGHLTSQPLDVIAIAPLGLLPAVLLSVAPAPDRAAAPEDRIITRRLLEAAWPAARRAFSARAAVIRTLPNEEAKRSRDYTAGIAPYLSADAARLLVERGIEHLIVDVPSVDRMMDEGRLAAHRVFFGLPPGATDLGLAARAHCTITELAYVPDAVPDGQYLLEIQMPALAGDAVPSRPLLYAAARIERRGPGRTAARGSTRQRARTGLAGARPKRGRTRGGRGRAPRSKHERR